MRFSTRQIHSGVEPDPVTGAFATQFGSHEGTSGLLKDGGVAAFEPIEGLVG